jgi:hypothetical protein
MESHDPGRRSGDGDPILIIAQHSQAIDDLRQDIVDIRGDMTEVKRRLEVLEGGTRSETATLDGSAEDTRASEGS